MELLQKSASQNEAFGAGLSQHDWRPYKRRGQCAHKEGRGHVKMAAERSDALTTQGVPRAVGNGRDREKGAEQVLPRASLQPSVGSAHTLIWRLLRHLNRQEHNSVVLGHPGWGTL